MKRFSVCLLVVLVLSIPGVCSAESDLAGSWNLNITYIGPDPSGTINTPHETTTMELNVSDTNPDFYSGTLTYSDGRVERITVVQDGHDIRFTISRPDPNSGGELKATTWGTGTANKKKIDGSWGNDLGYTGTVDGTR